MKQQYKLTLYRYLVALALLLITQIVFYALNASLFNVTGGKEFFNICIGNVRFALSSVSFWLSPFLLLALLPIPLQQNKIYRIATFILYVIGVEILLFTNLVDCGYFRFTFKRTTFDIFNYLSVGGDFSALIPQFLKDYWHIALIFVVLNVILFGMDFFLRKKLTILNDEISYGGKSLLKRIAFVAVAAVLIFITQRGGLQNKPLRLLHASNYATTQNTALVLNTPFTMYRTIGKSALSPKSYFLENEVDTVFSPICQPSSNVWTDTLFAVKPEVGKTNVVVIIVESYAAEYFSTYNKTDVTYVPFLDSLAKHSIVFNGMSNGKRSIDGIPSIVSSLPLLTEESYITSQYSENRLSSFAGLLEPCGYHTAFFHGGYNGTMSFDVFTSKVGFSNYFGKNEYGNDADYDGNWGIFDEPYLQYMVSKLNTFSQPFATAVFTLSSHHPYTIPEQHKGKFPKGTLVVHETVGYTDYALRKFFESAEKTDWFKNTIFIITADHSALTGTKEFQTELGLYRIPILIYSPMLKHGVNTDKTMQQIDILPTLADMLHVNKNIFAFGKSVFSEFPHYYIRYSNGEYILLIDKYISKYREGYDIQLFDAENDPDMRNDIATQHWETARYHEQLTKAIIQQYNNRLIHNQTIIENQ